MNSTENSVGDTMLSSYYALCVPYGMVGSMMLWEGGSFVAVADVEKREEARCNQKNLADNHVWNSYVLICPILRVH